MSLSFLLTNDDGFDAPGILALKEVLQSFGSVTIVAPAVQHSGCGHQVTNHAPIPYRTESADVHVIEGTPVDCVRIGLFTFAADCDWVFAGINEGGNLGIDYYNSGTVAAVREAAFHQRPAIAISQYIRQRPCRWGTSQDLARKAVEYLLDRPTDPGTFFNVNLPDLGDSPDSERASIVDCEADQNPMPLNFDMRDNAFSFRGRYSDRPRSTDRDIDVCFRDSISVTNHRPFG